MKTNKKIFEIILCVLCLGICFGCSKERNSLEDELEAALNKEEISSEDSSGEEMEEEVSEVEIITPEEEFEMRVSSYLEKMTLQEKVAQMFVVTPEALTGVEVVINAGVVTQEAINNIPVGGFVYLGQNIETPQQITEMLTNVQAYSMERTGLPMFTCLDEEGGTVARVNSNSNFNVPYIGNMSDVGFTGDVSQAYKIGQDMGIYLSELGFNVDFAPVADVLSNPYNEIVRYRSFGSDPELVSQMTIAVSDGLAESGVLSTFKHFPGHGATEGDTHEGYAYTSKTLEEISTCELVPFQRGIDAGISFIMVGHISLPNVIGDNTPSTLSYKMMTEILREKMGYEGIIITDAMNMGAITQIYTSADAAIKSIQAGADIILMPQDFMSAYQGVTAAVENQTISMERIDESVRRILRVKLKMME